MSEQGQSSWQMKILRKDGAAMRRDNLNMDVVLQTISSENSVGAATFETAPPRLTDVPTTSAATTSSEVTTTSKSRGRKLPLLDPFVDSFLSTIL